MALVRRIAEIQGGHVEAFSEGAGRGSTFVVHLPVMQDAEARQETGLLIDESDSLPPPPRRILLVEHNQNAAESLATLLQMSGHEVTITLSGMSALEIARTLLPDVIRLDIGLRGIDGFEVARRLRRKRCKT